MSTITIECGTASPSTLAGRSVLIGDRPSGTLDENGTAVIDVAPGHHVVRLAHGICRSEAAVVAVRPGADVRLRPVSDRATLVRELIGGWIRLERHDG